MQRQAQLVLVLGLWSSSAAAVDVEQCLDASERGQSERDSGALQAARESFVTCANQACPEVVRKDCVGWLAAVEHRIPSLVLRVRDPQGNDILGASVLLDGQALKQPAGHAISLDPGKHEIEFRHRRFAAQTLEILVREGERGRVVDAVLVPRATQRKAGAGLSSEPSAGDAAPVESESTIHTASWILGGVGVVGLASYAYFGLTAKSQRDDLDSCKPGCPVDEVDAARTNWILANVSFGVGVVALGAAVWISLGTSGNAESQVAQRRGVSASLVPMPGGGLGMLGGSF